MTGFRFSFKTIKQVIRKAGISGRWCELPDGRWRLTVEGHSGLEWSPTRSELSFFGAAETCKRLQSALEQVLNESLIASYQQHSDETNKLETITTGRKLLAWLLRYMRGRDQCSYPEPLVRFAEELVQELSAIADDGNISEFQGWSPFPNFGRNFAAMKHSCQTRPYSAMLMALAGRLHDSLIIDYVSMKEAVGLALKASELHELFSERIKGDRFYLRSSTDFEKRFRVRIRVELYDDE